MHKSQQDTDVLEVPRSARELGAAARKPYHPPQLQTFGLLTHLTETTSAGTMTDSGNMRSSDLALKENIVRIGTHPLGFGLYLFEYKPAFRTHCGHGRHFGVLAQEVERVLPAAVGTSADGYRQVDYRLLGIEVPLH